MCLPSTRELVKSKPKLRLVLFVPEVNWHCWVTNQWENEAGKGEGKKTQNKTKNNNNKNNTRKLLLLILNWENVTNGKVDLTGSGEDLEITNLQKARENGTQFILLLGTVLPVLADPTMLRPQPVSLNSLLSPLTTQRAQKHPKNMSTAPPSPQKAPRAAKGSCCLPDPCNPESAQL